MDYLQFNLLFKVNNMCTYIFYYKIKLLIDFIIFIYLYGINGDKIISTKSAFKFPVRIFIIVM